MATAFSATPQHEELVAAGVSERRRMLAMMRDFTVFGETPGGIAKIIAGCWTEILTSG